MLPLILRNVCQAMVTKYGFAFTSCIVAEHVKDGLVCINWSGHPMIDDLPQH